MLDLPISPPRGPHAELPNIATDRKRHPEGGRKQRRLGGDIVSLGRIADRIVAVDRGTIVARWIEGDRPARGQHADEVPHRDALPWVGQHFPLAASRTQQVSRDQVVQLAPDINRWNSHLLDRFWTDSERVWTWSKVLDRGS